MGHIFLPSPLDWGFLLPNLDCSLRGLMAPSCLGDFTLHFVCFLCKSGSLLRVSRVGEG